MIGAGGWYGRIRDWARREWPAALAILVLILGNIWLYGILGEDWHPVGPVFLLAIGVFIVGELVRWLYRRFAIPADE